MGSKKIQMTGSRFGRLVVLGEEAPYISPGGQRQRRVLAECDCGKTTITVASQLRTGETQSCGCLIREITAKRNFIHGEATRAARCPEHRVWTGMIQRCENPNVNRYHLYGGRGIKVCERWRDSFENFLADMGRRPSADYSIDRIDSNKDYEPGNCEWSNQTDQQNNRRNNHVVSYRGIEMTLSEAVRAAGSIVGRSTCLFRINNGWSIERAVETPTRATSKKT